MPPRKKPELGAKKVRESVKPVAPKPVAPSPAPKPVENVEVEFFCTVCRRPYHLKTYHSETVRGKDAYVGQCPGCGGRVCQYKANVEFEDYVQCKHCKSDVPKQKFCGACGKEL
jgi:hypothetical protein